MRLALLFFVLMQIVVLRNLQNVQQANNQGTSQNKKVEGTISQNKEHNAAAANLQASQSSSEASQGSQIIHLVPISTIESIDSKDSSAIGQENKASGQVKSAQQNNSTLGLITILNIEPSFKEDQKNIEDNITNQKKRNEEKPNQTNKLDAIVGKQQQKENVKESASQPSQKPEDINKISIALIASNKQTDIKSLIQTNRSSEKIGKQQKKQGSSQFNQTDNITSNNLAVSSTNSTVFNTSSAQIKVEVPLVEKNGSSLQNISLNFNEINKTIGETIKIASQQKNQTKKTQQIETFGVNKTQNILVQTKIQTKPINQTSPNLINIKPINSSDNILINNNGTNIAGNLSNTTANIIKNITLTNTSISNLTALTNTSITQNQTINKTLNNTLNTINQNNSFANNSENISRPPIIPPNVIRPVIVQPVKPRVIQFFTDSGLKQDLVPFDRSNDIVFRRVKKNSLSSKLDQKITELRRFKRNINGRGNNELNSQIGGSNTTYLRKCKTNYIDGDFEPQNGFRSSRQISNMIGAIRPKMQLNKENVTFLFTIWGQFVDHDIDGTLPGSNKSLNIPDGTKLILFTRSATDNKKPKTPINQITAWLDGSGIYGSSDNQARKLRSFSQGKLKTGPQNLLPTFTAGEMEAGDSRSNQNLVLLAFHTLFMREHNRICDIIIRNNKEFLSDEDVYTIAKNYVTALIQKITYDDFLPILLGEQAYKRFIGPYQGYNRNINSGIAVQFATAGFRFGHSLLVPSFPLINSFGAKTRTFNLSDLFFRPDLMTSDNFDQIFRGISRTVTKLRDGQFVDQIRNLLVLAPSLRQSKVDLLAINIQRGKDHGLPHYNDIRQCFGLKRLKNFDEVSGQESKNRQIRETYKQIDDIDSYVGIQAQKGVPGSILGEAGIQINGQQFQRLRAGDRFWYENIFPAEVIAQIKATKLSHIILRNSGIDELQENVFFYPFG